MESRSVSYVDGVENVPGNKGAKPATSHVASHLDQLRTPKLHRAVSGSKSIGYGLVSNGLVKPALSEVPKRGEKGVVGEQHASGASCSFMDMLL